jgi:N-acetylglucosaminyldiphosphoundecaprenol N-acetyl-beta-D-mannosaminyltransferase
LGVRMHERRSLEDVRRTLSAFLDGDEPRRVFTPNPEILLYAGEHPDFASLLNEADLALPDGVGIALMHFLRTRRRIRRWPGVDIAELAIRLAAARGDSVMFVGGKGGVAARAAARWRAQLPGLKAAAAGSDVVIGEDGEAESVEHGRALIERIRVAEPTVVLVAFGAPKQERWIARHARDIPSARILIGVGGSVDIWSGRVSRAPHVVHSLGLEWAWRLGQEPRRLARIARATLLFPLRVLRDGSTPPPTRPPARG